MSFVTYIPICEQAWREITQRLLRPADFLSEGFEGTDQHIEEKVCSNEA